MTSIIAWVWTQLPDESMELCNKLGFSGGLELPIEERMEHVWIWMGKRVIWANMEILQICLVFNGMIE
jgi:hypothetical protein